MIVTTRERWQSAGDRLRIGAEVVHAEDDEAALRVADDLPATAQVLALTTPELGTTVESVPVDAVEEVRWMRRGPDGRHTQVLRQPSTAATLDLRPHPEGGWYRETWRSEHTFTPDGYPGTRAAATGILFLLPPGEQSIWHAVRSAEVWLWHRGGPLDLDLGGDGDRPGTATTVTLGPLIEAGQHVQYVVPAGHWQAARPAGDEEVLVSCLVAPGFDFADFRS